jgi:hypothetical protein
MTRAFDGLGNLLSCESCDVGGDQRCAIPPVPVETPVLAEGFLDRLYEPMAKGEAVKEPELKPFNIDELKKSKGFWYIASPYSKFQTGMTDAWSLACQASGWLTLRGVCVFSPIAHSHVIASECEIPAADHDIWLRADKPLLERSCGVIVLQIPGWWDSVGVRAEVEMADGLKLPVVGMRWPR